MQEVAALFECYFSTEKEEFIAKRTKTKRHSSNSYIVRLNNAIKNSYAVNKSYYQIQGWRKVQLGHTIEI